MSEPDPYEKIDKVIEKRTQEDAVQREQKMGMGFKSKGVQKVYDNINFGKDLQENPIITDKYDKKVFGAEVIDLNSFLNMRVWPRSIYTTDKLLRLTASAQLEFLKRYLSKKRRMSFNWAWLIILFIGIVVALLVILFLLPVLPI